MPTDTLYNLNTYSTFFAGWLYIYIFQFQYLHVAVTIIINN